MKPKPELIRVVRSAEGDVSIDLNGKKPGRGAYICKSESCLQKAIKSRALERALSTKIPADIPDQLRMELKNEKG